MTTAKELRDAAQRARSRGDYSEARDLISEAMEIEREQGRADPIAPAAKTRAKTRKAA